MSFFLYTLISECLYFHIFVCHCLLPFVSVFPSHSLSLSLYLSIYLSIFFHLFVSLFPFSVSHFIYLWLSFLFFFFKWTVPGLFLIYFRLFKQHYNLYKLNLKNVHPVYGAGIQTHDLLNITTRPGFPPLLPPPLSFFIILLSRIVKFSHPFSRIKMFERNSRKILTTKSIERVLKTNLKT